MTNVISIKKNYRKKERKYNLKIETQFCVLQIFILFLIFTHYQKSVSFFYLIDFHIKKLNYDFI